MDNSLLSRSAMVKCVTVKMLVYTASVVIGLLSCSVMVKCVMVKLLWTPVCYLG